MTPQERDKTAADLAGILARGYDQHVQAHGPDGSHAIRTLGGSLYEVTMTVPGAASYIERGGERFAVHVIPLAGGDSGVKVRDTTDAAKEQKR